MEVRERECWEYSRFPEDWWADGGIAPWVGNAGRELVLMGWSSCWVLFMCPSSSAPFPPWFEPLELWTAHLHRSHSFWLNFANDQEVTGQEESEGRVLFPLLTVLVGFLLLCLHLGKYNKKKMLLNIPWVEGAIAFQHEDWYSNEFTFAYVGSEGILRHPWWRYM